MATEVKPGKYVARLILKSRNCYESDSLFDLKHHIIVTHSGEVFETHYDGIYDDFQTVRFDPMRRWDLSLLDKYQLSTDMSDVDRM